MLQDARKFSPVYPKIEYISHKDKMLYEIDMPDIHFGRLTWHEESGEDYDIKIADACVSGVLEKLLSHVKNYSPSKILLPINGDYFNVDNKMNVTSHGTPQNEDTRYQKTFRKGRELLVKVIDSCCVYAPVDVLIIKGNHDEEKSFYVGDALECWYHNNPNVKIDNGAMSRKYYSYGRLLLGFTHGYHEKLDKLPLIMAMEVPDLWGKSSYREIHTGDKHYKRDRLFSIDDLATEGTGVVVRILRSLAPTDAWTFNKGLVGALRAAEAFLWNEDGLIAQFTATPK